MNLNDPKYDLTPEEKESPALNNRIYIAGPMTGYENHNFPAFNAMEDLLIKEGYTNIINPAKHFNGDTTLPWHVYIAYDLRKLITCNIATFLDNWESSKGCQLEYLFCSTVEIPMYDENGDQIPPDTDYLPEAEELVNGDRASSYGHPYDDFKRQAEMISMWVGRAISPLDIPFFWIASKISRNLHTEKRDNLVDFCGYLLCFKKTLEKVSELKATKGTQDAE
ncbi:DUF4406 domain-containing protein [bacterium]|nr:DUF4406 domain-containing protein [bacterium]